MMMDGGYSPQSEKSTNTEDNPTRRQAKLTPKRAEGDSDPSPFRSPLLLHILDSRAPTFITHSRDREVLVFEREERVQIRLLLTVHNDWPRQACL